MSYISHLLYWFVRRGPIGLVVFAIAILGLGFYLQIGQNERDAVKAQVLIAGPPAVVDVAKFDRDSHTGPLREVAVRGQAVMDFAYRLTLEKDSGDDEAFMVPLVSETADTQTEIVGIALYSAKNFNHDRLTPEFLMNGLVGFGDVGPITDYNGKIRSLGEWDDLTQEAFMEKGLTFRTDLVIVWPFIDGREVAFAAPEAGDLTVFGMFSWVAGAIGLLALGKLVFRTKSSGKPTSVEQKLAASFPASAVAPVSQASAVPLWKQRSGVVDDGYVADAATFEPAQFDTSFVQAPSELPSLAKPPRARFVVRKVLIGIVGGLFVLGLVSIVSDLVGKSSTTTPVSVTTYQDLAAAAVADAVVPNADPNRHWTDIDVTPVIEWFVAKFFLAVAGDGDAQLKLAMIAGGLFFGMFMLRYFFAMRSALRPKTTARFDSMGIN